MHDKTRKILIVDDEAPMRHMLKMVLERGGYQVLEAEDGAAALVQLEKQPCDIVLCDVRMPTLDGMGFLQEVITRRWPLTVIMMSAYGTLDTAVDCLKAGAFDYISKPFKPDEILLTLAKAEERLRLQNENDLLRRELDRKVAGREIIYASPNMAQVMGLVERAAAVHSPVLITGETGTGKELIARALHRDSVRREKPFVAINCGAISAGIIESELFGHLRGAFTGADRNHEGLFAAAQGGTLFLDEIGELPLELQPKLLRVLQEGEVRPVGGVTPRRTDVRLIAATARNLHEEIEAERFRSDLFFRLAVIEIHLPPLRERVVDIPLLAEHFLARIATRERLAVPQLIAEAAESLKGYHWPGNVRELANFMEKTVIFCRNRQIRSEDLPLEVRGQSREAGELSLKKIVARLEREYIRKALTITSGNRTRAAGLLDISLRSLQYKIREYGLE